MAVNTALLSQRRRRTRPTSIPLSDTDPPRAAKTPDPDLERLQLSIRSLRELDRAVILLYLEQHTHEEIADLTGLSRKNVGVRIVRIKQQLRQWLTAPPSVARTRESG